MPKWLQQLVVLLVGAGLVVFATTLKDFGLQTAVLFLGGILAVMGGIALIKH